MQKFSIYPVSFISENFAVTWMDEHSRWLGLIIRVLEVMDNTIRCYIEILLDLEILQFALGFVFSSRKSSLPLVR